MQLFILTALVSFLVAAPYDRNGDFKAHGDIVGNKIDTPIHAPSNNCSNNSKAIGDAKNSFDNSCENIKFESDTDAHNDNGNRNGNRWKSAIDTHVENRNILKSNNEENTGKGNTWKPEDS
jgi:hypothetical protein